MKKICLSLLAIILVSVSNCFGQDSEPDIDTSKPTNFYSFLDNTFEYSSQPTQNIMGYRGKITFAPSEAHLLLGDVPILYNDRTSKFGIGDIRARYFWLPYKNYDKFLGAFGPSLDVFFPTGSLENGLGSDRFLVSPGITIGLMAAEWIQFFPILSYQYGSDPVSDFGKEMGLSATHGITFQVITPIVFSNKLFFQVTPIFQLNNINDERADRYVQELFAAYSLKEKLQLTAFYSGNFKDEIHTVSVGLTIFL